MKKRYLQCLVFISGLFCLLPGIILWHRLLWTRHIIPKDSLYIHTSNQTTYSENTKKVSLKIFDNELSNTKLRIKGNTIGNCVGNRIYLGRENAVSALTKRTLVSLHWQMADDKCDVYVYSAYLDDLEWEIRIMGITRTRNTTISVQCYTWTSSNDNNPRPAKGSVWYLPDVMMKRYSAVIISCPVNERSRPFAISVTVNDSDITNIIKISYPSQKNNITVCLPALHSYYKHTNILISFIEMNRMLGAQRFIVYNYNVTPEVNHVLKGYANDNIIEVIQWDIPVKDIHYFGQNVIINDCLYRNLHVSQYLVYSDLDEILMPKKHKNWMGLIKSIVKNDSNIGSILFRNTFFSTSAKWIMDVKGYKQSKEAQMYGVVPLLRVWRERLIYPPYKRSKLIVIPERVRAVRIHQVDTSMYRNKSKVHVVDPELGLLHHYRWVLGKPERVKDDTIRQYSDQLLSSVRRSHSRYKQ